MKLRKKNYKHIQFPIDCGLEFGDRLKLYLKELDLSEPLTWQEVTVLYVNAYSDFVENKIDSWLLSSIAFDLIASLSDRSDKWQKVKNPTIRLLIGDIDNCLDINWLMESEGFDKLKREMADRLSVYESLYDRLKSKNDF